MDYGSPHPVKPCGTIRAAARYHPRGRSLARHERAPDRDGGASRMVPGTWDVPYPQSRLLL